MQHCVCVQGCRSVEEFHCLNRIEEGTYGVVYRAEDRKTDEIVALKRLKMEKEKEGFPITSLREINTLLKAQHTNIVTVRVSGGCGWGGGGGCLCVCVCVCVCMYVCVCLEGGLPHHLTARDQHSAEGSTH